MGDCADCGKPTGSCSNASAIGWDCAISSCMSQLGVTDNMSLCAVIANIANGICNISRCVQNTAFVTPCGDDVTGTIGNFFKPFKTIKAAVKATTSDSGNLVYVFPGTYAETLINKGTDNIEKTGVDYYFSPGTTVLSINNSCWVAALTGSTVIRGAAIFQSTVDAFTSTASYNFDIECQSIQSLGTANSAISIHGGGTFRLKCSSVTSTGAACMDIRTVTSTGYVECDLFDNQNGALGSPCVKFDAGGTHNWIFKVKELKTTSNLDGNCGGVVVKNTTAKVYWSGNVFQNNPSSPTGFCGGVTVNGGELIFNGDITTITGHGAICIAGTLVLNSCIIRGGGNDACAICSLAPPGNGLLIANNCMLVNSSNYQPTVSHQSSVVTSMQLTGCLIVNENNSSASINIAVTNTAQRIRLTNCVMYTPYSGGVSLLAVVAINTQIINCWANKPTSGTITDLVQPINVDSDIILTIP